MLVPSNGAKIEEKPTSTDTPGSISLSDDVVRLGDGLVPGGWGSAPYISQRVV